PFFPFMESVMHSLARNVEQNPELVPLNVIRVETALSRYPIHRLAKQGTASIQVRETSPTGDVLICWEVTHNNRYGQPGPLAYKVDTIIVNRRLDEAGRPIPKIIRLGSINDFCRKFGLRECGRNTNHLKKAFYQNATAFITAKLRYKSSNGTWRTTEVGDTRYGVVFTGETLPDGRIADAVYLVLHDFYREILDSAPTRPLDYDYLRDLPPASQRLYELLSFPMYAALKHDRPRAKLAYSEFCVRAPQSRYFERERVRKQMYKVHAPHRKSGYIEHAEFEPTTDQEGRPDWLMHYTPGPKAHAEYRAFTKRGAEPQVLEIEQPSPALPLSPLPEPTPLVQELITRGVTASTARELAAAYPEEQIRRQIEQTDWLKKKTPNKITNLGAYLAQAVREDFAPPPGFESQADREKRRAAEETQRRREQEEARRRQAEEARERAEQARILDYWHALGPAAQRRLEADALEQADESAAQSYRELLATGNPLAPTVLRCIREAHIRKLLAAPPQDAGHV
ncbi:MAG TPA: hypothetical protein VKP69_26820, partial [Isosphaeraceae bacterium]|nr:hypothetical protein [Isosphaeraceae bacterium]